MTRPRPLVLTILDGFGERAEEADNAVRLAKAPNLAAMRAEYPKTLIDASGPAVGLPKGQMGNSEVGHLNFGAGRVAQMDLSLIDVAVAERNLAANPVISHLLRENEGRKLKHKDFHSKPFDKVPARMHLLGLLSDGGVHSSIDHLLALVDVFSERQIPVVVHAFLDGRDTPPRSALKYIERLAAELKGRGEIGTVSGRYYAMDRDKHWDRVRLAFDAIVVGDAFRHKNAVDYVHEQYDRDITDEFIEPARIGTYEGLRGGPVGLSAASTKISWEWHSEEDALCFNFRPDRMRELCAMLLCKNLPSEVEESLKHNHIPIRAFNTDTLVSLTEYDPKLEMRVAFPKEAVDDSFGEVISRAGLKQFRCAETEKYAHVTYFFNGGREAAFDGEDRKLVPSPRDVATYDKKPEMSAAGVTAAVLDAIHSDTYDFILVNYANPDMVGHTGDLAAATHAVEAVDVGLGAVRDAVLAKGGALIVTADHGNCETMVDAEGNPHTAHTTNPVPLYYVSATDKDVTLREGGRLADVAPTMLEILGIEQPAKMTGRSLRVPRGA